MKPMKDFFVEKVAQKVHQEADDGPFHGEGDSKSP